MFIAIFDLLSTAACGRLGHEADLLDARTLGGEHHATDEFIATREVAADWTSGCGPGQPSSGD
jgi:hypothetical protein